MGVRYISPLFFLNALWELREDSLVILDKKPQPWHEEIDTYLSSWCWTRKNGGHRRIHKIMATKSVNKHLLVVNTLGSRHNGHHFADDIFKCIFLNKFRILTKISLKLIPNIPVLVQIMALIDLMTTDVVDIQTEHPRLMSGAWLTIALRLFIT